MTTKCDVSLISFTGVGLIVKRETGVVYHGQAGGVGAGPVSCEGFFVPLPTQPYSERLVSVFNGAPVTLNEEEALEVDSALYGSSDTDFIRVDRAQLDESREAWVHVICRPTKFPFPLLTGLDNAKAVLVWENSD